MEKRVTVCFAGLMLAMLVCILSVFTLSNGTALAASAKAQGSYKINVAKTRGTIYDCNLLPLTGTTEKLVAAVAPSVDSAAALSKALNGQAMAETYPLLEKGKPFLLALPAPVSGEGIQMFRLDQRYTAKQPASHTVGYLDGSGKGIAGIEKAFDSVLSADQGGISVNYRVDALNRVLPGEGYAVSDNSYLKRSGVVLTLDSRIQEIAQQAAENHLKEGAVVVMEVSSGKLRAMVSLPDFSPTNIAASLEDSSAPLLNRCVSAYNVGSVFKIVSAAAALEYGIPAETRYVCRGGISVDGLDFHCYNAEAHGDQDMCTAISNSCNAYFVSLMQQMPQSRFLLMAQTMGFGSSYELAPGYAPVTGNLPDQRELSQPRALANFSFGQGSLTATPLQIAAMINTVASGGYYVQPSLVERTVDANLKTKTQPEPPVKHQVMSEGTAEQLKAFMAQSVDVGTSKRGKPVHWQAAAKTATAQTGRYDDNGVEKVESWFAGFYPVQDPKYVVVVLGEGGTGGGALCGPVFKEIVDGLYEKGIDIPKE